MTGVLEPVAAEERTWVDRMLAPFSEVQAGEGITALLLAFNIFLLLTFHFTVPQFAVVNVLLVVIWLGLVTAIAREHRKLDPVDSLRSAA